MDVQWQTLDENVFGAVIKIAHYTGFGKEEILNWTIDEINKALEIVKNHEKQQAHLLFSVADYQRLMESVPTNNNGTVNQSERSKLINKAQNIRSVFTGEEVEKQQNNSTFFVVRNEQIVEEMSLEEFKKYKEEHGT